MLIAAADSGNWAEFVRLMGGPTASRKQAPIQLLRQWSDKPGQYGEPVGVSVIGVVYGDYELITRIHTWKIDFKSSADRETITGSSGTELVRAGTRSGTRADIGIQRAGTLQGGAGTRSGTEPVWAGTRSGTGSVWIGDGAGTGTNRNGSGSEKNLNSEKAYSPLESCQ